MATEQLKRVDTSSATRCSARRTDSEAEADEKGRDGLLANVDVTGVLDLVVGRRSFLRPASLLGSREAARGRKRPREIFPVPLFGSRDATRRRKGPREIFVVTRAFLRPVPRLLEAQSGDARV